jgi:class 3 adenylate cyclase
MTDIKKKVNNHQESKITILSLLKNYYDNEIFYSLIKEIYNSDIPVSLAAIEASASLGNEIVIPHLYEVIEKGRPEQRKTGIQALAGIKAPSTIPRLLEYYDFYKNDEIRLTILVALNGIDPRHEKVIELNKRIVQNPYLDASRKKCAVEALVDAEEFPFLERYFSVLPQAAGKAVFLKVLKSRSKNIPRFLASFLKDVDRFPPSLSGCYLAAYQAKLSRQPRQSFVLKKLNNTERKTLVTYLLAVEKNGKNIEQPLQVFRTLLIIPYLNRKCETITGESLKKIILKGEEIPGFLLNEMVGITKTHIENILTKVKRDYISCHNNDKKEKLLMRVFAHLLENYGTSKLIHDIKEFFKSQNNEQTVPALIARIKRQCTGGGLEEQKILEACFSLFHLQDAAARIEILACLNKIELRRPMLLRRLNRLIRVAGTLGMRNSIKIVHEVLDFARGNRIPFLEETCIVTLCQLHHRNTIEHAGRYLQYTDTPAFRGYIRGAGYIHSTAIGKVLLDLLSQPLLEIHDRELIVNSIEQMHHQNIKTVLEKLLHIISLRQIPGKLKERIGDYIMSHPISFLFPMLLDFVNHTDESVQCIALKAMKKITCSREKLPFDLLVSRLYILLDEGTPRVKNHALLTLLSLDDDYAVQVFKDYLADSDEQVIVDIIQSFESPFSHDILKLIISLVWRKSRIIQETLRQVITRLIQDGYSQEIRNILLEYLKQDLSIPGTLVREPVYQERETLAGYAKRKYKFKRENNQLVTVMFLDMAGYTEKSSETDSIALMNLIDRFEEFVIPVITDYKGDIIKKMGDGILAVFKNPLNACFAALMIQEKIKDKNMFTVEKDKIQVRIGMNTGEVIRKEGDVYGDVVNVASRMETAATPGDILLTQSTYDEIKEYIQCIYLGNINVKGKKEAIPAYAARNVMNTTRHILSESRNKLDTFVKNRGENSLTVLTESLFTPDFSFPETFTRYSEILDQVSRIFQEITQMGEEITHDYYDEYALKRFIQEKWDFLLDTLEHEPSEF